MGKDYSELIKYLDEKFIEVKSEITELRNNFSDLQGSVDAYAKRADDYFQKMVMLAHKIDRHEKWIQQIAGKLDLKLDY
ncbi:hypothetical protein KJ616_02565 [Patescibacteria group bacterium]|nr:hypothetical protein [Patescibacteria group bacterium]